MCARSLLVTGEIPPLFRHVPIRLAIGALTCRDALRAGRRPVPALTVTLT